jgi:hypothetical protein
VPIRKVTLQYQYQWYDFYVATITNCTNSALITGIFRFLHNKVNANNLCVPEYLVVSTISLVPDVAVMSIESVAVLMTTV